MDSLLTPKDVQRILRCSLAWVYKAAEQGFLPCIRIPSPSTTGKRPKSMLRFKQSEIFKFIEAHSQSAKPPVS
ncbi:MAG: helix-turn-helix domain-containing protein [Deltaproteobacteria bacterium]|nr:helix-turn-helix domain-containing protein [Deltaproteobacteria bacterium]